MEIENNVNNNLIDDEQPQKPKRRVADKIFVIVLCCILLLMTAMIFVNKFVFLNVYVEGQSMAPTLSSGDVLFAYKGNDIEVGDIVVIDGEKSNGKNGYDLLIKRVIAIGQKDKTIVVEISGGKVYVGDTEQTLKLIKEDYLPEGTITSPQSPEYKFRWYLEEGDVFYLGDNRDHSSDSRYSSYDVCKVSQIVGVVPEWAVSMRWLSGFMYKTGKFFSDLF
jgi:signal peptidase I